MPRALLALILAAASSLSMASGLRAESAWIRSAPPVAPVRAGYVRLVNDSAQDVVLSGATSPAFGAIEFHSMVDDAGTARMRRQTELRVPAGGSLELKPGGLHLMLFRPTTALADGAEVTVTLQSSSSEYPVSFRIQAEAP